MHCLLPLGRWPSDVTAAINSINLELHRPDYKQLVQSAGSPVSRRWRVVLSQNHTVEELLLLLIS